MWLARSSGFHSHGPVSPIESGLRTASTSVWKCRPMQASLSPCRFGWMRGTDFMKLRQWMAKNNSVSHSDTIRPD